MDEREEFNYVRHLLAGKKAINSDEKEARRIAIVATQTYKHRHRTGILTAPVELVDIEVVQSKVVNNPHQNVHPPGKCLVLRVRKALPPGHEREMDQSKRPTTNIILSPADTFALAQYLAEEGLTL